MTKVGGKLTPSSSPLRLYTSHFQYGSYCTFTHPPGHVQISRWPEVFQARLLCITAVHEACLNSNADPSAQVVSAIATECISRSMVPEGSAYVIKPTKCSQVGDAFVKVKHNTPYAQCKTRNLLSLREFRQFFSSCSDASGLPEIIIHMEALLPNASQEVKAALPLVKWRSEISALYSSNIPPGSSTVANETASKKTIAQKPAVPLAAQNYPIQTSSALADENAYPQKPAAPIAGAVPQPKPQQQTMRELLAPSPHSPPAGMSSFVAKENVHTKKSASQPAALVARPVTAQMANGKWNIRTFSEEDQIRLAQPKPLQLSLRSPLAPVARSSPALAPDNVQNVLRQLLPAETKVLSASLSAPSPDAFAVSYASPTSLQSDPVSKLLPATSPLSPSSAPSVSVCSSAASTSSSSSSSSASSSDSSAGRAVLIRHTDEDANSTPCDSAWETGSAASIASQQSSCATTVVAHDCMQSSAQPTADLQEPDTPPCIAAALSSDPVQSMLQLLPPDLALLVQNQLEQHDING